MIAHDAVAAQPHTVTLDALGKDGFEGREILLFFEDAQAAVGTIHRVIDDISFRDAFGSAHDGRL